MFLGRIMRPPPLRQNRDDNETVAANSPDTNNNNNNTTTSTTTTRRENNSNDNDTTANSGLFLFHPEYEQQQQLDSSPSLDRDTAANNNEETPSSSSTCSNTTTMGGNRHGRILMDSGRHHYGFEDASGQGNETTIRGTNHAHESTTTPNTSTKSRQYRFSMGSTSSPLVSGTETNRMNYSRDRRQEEETTSFTNSDTDSSPLMKPKHRRNHHLISSTFPKSSTSLPASFASPSGSALHSVMTSALLRNQMSPNANYSQHLSETSGGHLPYRRRRMKSSQERGLHSVHENGHPNEHPNENPNEHPDETPHQPHTTQPTSTSNPSQFLALSRARRKKFHHAAANPITPYAQITFSTLFAVSLFTFFLGRMTFSVSWLLLCTILIWMLFKRIENTKALRQISALHGIVWLWSQIWSRILLWWPNSHGAATASSTTVGSPTTSTTSATSPLRQTRGRRSLLDSSSLLLESMDRDSMASGANSAFFDGSARPQAISSPSSNLPFNFIIAALWSTWDNSSIQTYMNDLIKESQSQFSSAFIEQVEVTYVDMDTTPRGAPIITELRCTEATLERTVLEFDIEYNGDFRMEWFMRPKVLPINLRCMLKDIIMEGTLRLEIEYVREGSMVGSFGEVNISFAEYPSVLEGSVQMFESLDFQSLAGSIPAVTGIVKRKFEEMVSMVVYPNTYVLHEDPAKQSVSGDKRDNLPLHFGIESRNITEMEDLGLEDEIKNTLLDINNLLKTRMAQGTNTDAVRREVSESVLQFLRYGTEPGRIPVSMMEMVKRAFQILNRLAFDDQKQGEICLSVFEEIIKPENFQLIGDVARGGTLADDLLDNIMKLKKKELQKRVNETLRELNMEDVVWIIRGRAGSGGGGGDVGH